MAGRFRKKNFYFQFLLLFPNYEIVKLTTTGEMKWKFQNNMFSVIYVCEET